MQLTDEPRMTFPQVPQAHPILGDLIGTIMQYANLQQNMGAQRRAQLAQDSSAQAINQQMGTPGQDPFLNQKFASGQLMQDTGKYDLSHRQLVDQQAQDWGQNFMQGAQGLNVGNDPLLGALLQGGSSPQAAQAAYGYLNPQAQENQRFRHESTLQKEKSASTVNTAAEVARIQNEGDMNKLKQQQGFLDERSKKTGEPVGAFIRGEGGMDAVLASDPSLADNPYAIAQLVEQRKQFLAEQKAAIDAAKNKKFKDENAGVGPGEIKVPTSSSEQQAFQVELENQRYNKQHQLWDYLPDQEKQVLERDPKIIDKIIAEIGRPTGLNYKSVLPHIYQMAQNQIGASQKKADRPTIKSGKATNYSPFQ